MAPDTKPQPGDRLGELTILRRQYLGGGRLLFCRCRCGQSVKLWTRASAAVVCCSSCAAGQLSFVF